jgi:hypothetical protein
MEKTETGVLCHTFLMFGIGTLADLDDLSDDQRGRSHTPSICRAGQTLQMEKSTSSSFSRIGQ